MSAFSSRFLGYKIGVVCLFLLTVLFLVGFSTPFWVEERHSGTYNSKLFPDPGFIVKFTKGLWMFCETNTDTGETLCHAITGEVKAWLQGVRTQECVSLLLLLAACAYSVAVNCCRSQPGPRSRALEAVVAVAGLNGLTGTVVYVVMKKHEIFGYLAFSWALYLTAVVSGAVVAVALLIAISNKARDVTPPTTAPPAYELQPVNGYPSQAVTVFNQRDHLNNRGNQSVTGQVYFQHQSSGMRDGPPPSFNTASGQVCSQNQSYGMLNGPPPDQAAHTPMPGQAGYPVSRQIGPPIEVGYAVSRQNEPLSQAGYPVSSHSGYLLRADNPVLGQTSSSPNYASDRNIQSSPFDPSTNTTYGNSPRDRERLKPSAPAL